MFSSEKKGDQKKTASLEKPVWIWGINESCIKLGTKFCETSLPEQYTGQPKDSDDQTSVHSCCRLSSEKHGEDDTPCKCRSTSLLLYSHWSKHPSFGVSSLQAVHHSAIPRMKLHHQYQEAECSLGLYLDLYPMSYREKTKPTLLFINSKSN